MEKLDIIFRYMPLHLFLFGILLTGAELMELKINQNSIFIVGDTSYDIRLLYVAAGVRSFYNLFFFWGLAAIIAGLNKHNSKGAN